MCERTRKMEDVKVRLMSKENTMDPDPESTKIMLLLPKLTDIEEMFIARVHVVMKVYRLSKGVAGCQGNMLNVEQDVVPVFNKLPLLPENLPTFVARKNNPNAPGDYKDFKINRNNMLTWLVWLKQNSSNYADIIIDMDALSQLPIDGTMFDQLRSYDEIDDVNDETDADMGGNEPGPEQGNATGDAAGDETMYVAEAHANVNNDHETETMQQGMLNILKEELNQNENGNAENLGTVNNPMPFP